MRSDAEERHYGGGESDEHKAYKDRAVRAAEEGGHTAAQERSSKDRAVRSDVLIRGTDGVLLGFESQLSSRNPREIQAETWRPDERAFWTPGRRTARRWRGIRRCRGCVPTAFPWS
ncbi:hypothetical protein ACWCXK_27020 [Streptomyces sp. NPDC001739]